MDRDSADVKPLDITRKVREQTTGRLKELTGMRAVRRGVSAPLSRGSKPWHDCKKDVRSGYDRLVERDQEDRHD
jgi:hypothetical protein